MSGFEALLAGHTLADRYLVEALVGRGGMGAVFRATDRRLGRAVAVKVISPAGGVEPEGRAVLRARFAREARAAARLHHPHVVGVYDFGTDAALDLDFLVMELLHGEDLAQRLARGWRPSVDEAVAVLRAAARGLAAGHRMGLVHRDVKPGNLFLCGDGEDGEALRVLDFGIAQVAREDGTVTHFTRWGGPPLSPAYAAPEQLRGETALGPACDVYGLGAVAYQLLAGRRPLDDDAVRRLAAGREAALPAPLEAGDDVSPALAALVARALAFDPLGRPADADALLDELDAALGLPARPTAIRRSIDVVAVLSTGGEDDATIVAATGADDGATAVAPAREPVRAAPTPSVARRTASPALPDRCTDCARVLADDARFCPGCGAAVEGRVSPDSVERRRAVTAGMTPRRRVSGAAALAAGIALLAGAAGATAVAAPEVLALSAWRAAPVEPAAPPVRDLPAILVQRQERVREARWAAQPLGADGGCGGLFDTCIRVQCRVTNTGDARGTARVTALIRGGSEYRRRERVALDPGEGRILTFEFREARHGERFDEAMCTAQPASSRGEEDGGPGPYAPDAESMERAEPGDGEA